MLLRDFIRSVQNPIYPSWEWPFFRSDRSTIRVTSIPTRRWSQPKSAMRKRPWSRSCSQKKRAEP